MERLTKRCGDAVLIADSIDERYSANEVIDILAERLAAYEETGLTPEEIKAITSTTELRINKDLTEAEAEELRQMLREHPGFLMVCGEDKADVCVTCENEAARAGRVVDYLPGDTVYDCFGMAWTVTSSEIHKFGDGPLRYLYRCGHPGTDDYCALYSYEIQPPPEAGL